MGACKTAGRAAWILMSAYFLYVVGFIFLADIELILAGIPDDAAYFFKAGENMAAGKGLTFDGINPSNGFQPLWLVVVAGAAFIFEARPEMMFRYYLVLQALLLILAAGILFLVHRRAFNPLVSMLVIALFMPLVFFQSINGMESAIFVFSLTLAFLIVCKLKPFHREGRIWLPIFGFCLGFVMLSRLDSVFIGASVCALILYQALKHQVGFGACVKMLAIVIGCASVATLPYLVYNQVRFGSFMPISGSLKSTFPDVCFDLAKIMNISPRFQLAVLAAPFYLAWSGISSLSASPERNQFRAAVGALALGVILHFLHVMMFLDWAVFSWHYLFYALFLTLAVSEPAKWVSERLKRRAAPAFAVIVIVLIIVGGSKVVSRTLAVETEDSWRVQSYRAAVWARNNTPPDSIFAMKDAGNFGYFSGRTVINLDGLVNNEAYQEVLRDGLLREYLASNNVDYLVQQCVYPGDKFFRVVPELSNGPLRNGSYDWISVRYWSHRFDAHSDAIPLYRKNEIYRSEQWNPRAVLPFVIWKLDLIDQDPRSI